MSKIKNIPEKIYLQIGDECPYDADFNELSEISWNKDKIYENDIEFMQNKGSDVSAEEESEFELLLMVKKELLEADKLTFAERIEANKDILNFVSIKRRSIVNERKDNVGGDAVEFAEWISSEGYQLYDGAGVWIAPQNNNNTYTTEELYQQYLQSLK